MTLIVVAATEKEVALVADRRLTGVDDDNHNKCFMTSYEDARLAVSFTGLARAGSHHTRRWLMQTLLETATPDYLMWPSLNRLAERATADFKRVRTARTLDKRLTVVLCGYWYGRPAPILVCFRVSNCEGGGIMSSQWLHPRDRFDIEWFRGDEGAPALFHGIFGDTRDVAESDWDHLLMLTRRRRPGTALIARSVALMRRAWSVRKDDSTVGPDYTGLILSPDPAIPAAGDYFPSAAAQWAYLPGTVTATRQASFMMDDPSVAFGDDQGGMATTAVPLVGRNAPCPCGSGMRYRQCHGQRRARSPSVAFGDGPRRNGDDSSTTRRP
jgi:SEC-C motif